MEKVRLSAIPREGLYMTVGGRLARVVKLVSRSKKWMLRGAIWEPEFKVWMITEWFPDGEHIQFESHSLKHETSVPEPEGVA